MHKPLPVILVGDALNLVSWQVVALTTRIKNLAESAPENECGAGVDAPKSPQKCKLEFVICST